jgi:hypothetical protein
MLAWYNQVSRFLGTFCQKEAKPCFDKATIICENKNLYGGCKGSAKKYFKSYCQKTCGYC